MSTILETYFFLEFITKTIEKGVGYRMANACISKNGCWVYIEREAKDRITPTNLRFLNKYNFKCKIGEETDEITSKKTDTISGQLSFVF